MCVIELELSPTLASLRAQFIPVPSLLTSQDLGPCHGWVTFNKSVGRMTSSRASPHTASKWSHRELCVLGPSLEVCNVLAQAEAIVGSSEGRSLPVQFKEVGSWVSFGCVIRSSWTDLWFLDLR